LHTGTISVSASQSIHEILDTKPLVRDARAARASARQIAPTVTFDDVTFAYAGGRGAAHDGLSFDVKSGERIGFVGPSGSGKSTIARLVLRLYDPQRGRVLIGGYDARELSLADLRSQIAVVN